MFKEDNSYSFMILIASTLLFILFLNFSINEIKSIFLLLDFDLEVNWFVSILLLLFYAFVLIISISLFINHIKIFNLKKFLKDSKLKNLLLYSIVINVLGVLFIFLNEYIFKIEDIFLLKFIIGTILFVFCSYAFLKNISPFYFLFSVLIISTIIWIPIFMIF